MTIQIGGIDVSGTGGYRVTQSTVGAITEVQGRLGDEALVFRASDAAMTLQGESECVAVG